MLLLSLTLGLLPPFPGLGSHYWLQEEGGPRREGGRFITFEEVKRFLKPEPIISSIQKGSIVELISGPFKGERAKVVRIDESREEVVLELIEAAVPIPVTVKADQIRIIQKEAD